MSIPVPEPPQPSQPPDADAPSAPDRGWRRTRFAPSLAEVYRTIPVSHRHWFRKILAFAGPGYLVTGVAI